jgi:hypothetical protein
VCAFTDLAVGAALPSFAITFASVPGSGAAWSAGLLPTTTTGHSSTGCYAPVSCGGLGTCRSAAAFAAGEPVCECNRGRFGDSCAQAIAPAVSVAVAVAQPAIATILPFSGGGALVLSAGALPWPANVSADLYDPAELPAALLPSLNDSFAPASLVVDLRPSGIMLKAPVTLQLVSVPVWWREGVQEDVNCGAGVWACVRACVRASNSSPLA